MAFDKARALEKATRTPGKTNMVAFAAAGGAIGAICSMLFFRNSSSLTRILAASGAAGGGAYLGSQYTRTDVARAVTEATKTTTK